MNILYTTNEIWSDEPQQNTNEGWGSGRGENNGNGNGWGQGGSGNGNNGNGNGNGGSMDTPVDGGIVFMVIFAIGYAMYHMKQNKVKESL
jgi:hypothetical protein